MLKIIDNNIFSNSNVPPPPHFCGKFELINLCPIKLVDPTFLDIEKNNRCVAVWSVPLLAFTIPEVNNQKPIDLVI